MMNEEEISICNAVMPDYVSTISMQLKEIEIMYGSCQYVSSTIIPYYYLFLNILRQLKVIEILTIKSI